MSTDGISLVWIMANVPIQCQAIIKANDNPVSKEYIPNH